MDEAKLKLNGKQLFVWAAVDTKSKEVLACVSHGSATGSAISCRLRLS